MQSDSISYNYDKDTKDILTYTGTLFHHFPNMKNIYKSRNDIIIIFTDRGNKDEIMNFIEDNIINKYREKKRMIRVNEDGIINEI